MSGWREAPAPAKLNLALVVGPRRPDGRHDVVTVLERLSLADRVAVRPAPATRVSGFEEDTLVRAALEAVSESAQGGPRFEARIEKRIPVAAGLGGGSSDAGTAIRLANGLLERPLPAHALQEIAAALGADVPFFLRDSAQVGTTDGTDARADRPPARLLGRARASRWCRQVLDRGRLRGIRRTRRRARVRCAAPGAPRRALAGLERASDLGKLPPNDLAASPLTERLRSLGAFRADVTGAGPAVYGLFEAPDDAGRAAAALGPEAATWIAQPG